MRKDDGWAQPGLLQCFKMMGGKPSLPIAVEGSEEMRAKKVSSIEIHREQRAFSGNSKTEESGN